MNKTELQQYVETQQVEADSLAYYLIKAKGLMILQSICDFNVWWLADISPLLMNDKTVEFLNKNKERFTRKITIKEFILYDAIIKFKGPQNFDEFAMYVKTQKFYRN